MGMVKLQPSQNQNPLTDYENFAQLIKSTRRTRNPKFVQIDPKGASGQIREKRPYLFSSD